MRKVAKSRKATAIYPGYHFREVDDWSTVWGGRSAIFQARGTWFADVGFGV